MFFIYSYEIAEDKNSINKDFYNQLERQNLIYCLNINTPNCPKSRLNVDDVARNLIQCRTSNASLESLKRTVYT